MKIKNEARRGRALPRLVVFRVVGCLDVFFSMYDGSTSGGVINACLRLSD